MARVYLDHNATTPLRAEARNAMIAAMDQIGNPSSVHAEGRAAKSIIERARGQVSAALGADGADIVFTSSATEAAAEHDAVLSWTSGDLSVTENGAFAPDDPKAATVQLANSETGVVQNLPDGLALSDMTQAFGKIPLAFNWSGADMALVSAHKLGGPKGIGALVLKRGLDVKAQIKGGGQEMGRRSGTENIIGIAGFGAAAEAAQRDLDAGVWDEVEKLRNILENAIADRAKHTIFVGKDVARLPNTSCLLTPGWRGETQVMQMDLEGFAISAGSACSSGKVKASSVLRAMGYSESDAACAIRVSLGPETTEQEVLAFADAWLAKHEKFRARAA